MKVAYSFHWKSLTADKFQKLALTEESAGKFEKSEKPTTAGTTEVSYKRKSETVELELPEWVETIPKLAQDAVANLVASFLRREYLDDFLPVGDHSWETVEREMMAAGGGRKKLDFSDETLSAAAASFGGYIGGLLSAPKVGERIAEAAAAKFSMAALQKHLSQSDEAIITKLITRLNSWAAWLAENDEDKAEEFASVYEYFVGRLQKNLEKLKEVETDIGAIL